MTTPQQFIEMRSEQGVVIEQVIDARIASAAEEGSLLVEVTVDPKWKSLEQVIRAYRYAGWKVTHYERRYANEHEVVLRFEVVLPLEIGK